MAKILYELKGTSRHAVIKEGTYFVKEKFVVEFSYEGYPDYEWKRGSHGIACDVCDTLEQAIGKAKRYVAKDKIYA